jgi:hypothetical protein
MKPLLINFIVAIFLISCASSNTYMKKYKDYSCEQIQKESDNILNELKNDKAYLGDKVLDGVIITFCFLSMAGGVAPPGVQTTTIVHDTHWISLKNAHKALDDLAIEKNCPSKPYILQMRELILRSPDVDGRIDSR